MKKLIKILEFISVVSIILCIIVINVVKKENKEKDNILTIGLDDSFPPMGFRNEKNELVGFDIDLARVIGNEIGMDVKFQPISWAEKEQELDSGKIDCIWNGFAYTEERAKIMTLSDVYIKGEMYFILKKGSKVKSQDDLKGKKIGVQNGSVQQVDLEKSEFGKNVEILGYGDFLTAFMDLDTAFKKGNVELKDKIQNTFNRLLNDGKLDYISTKWFGTDIFFREGDN